MTVQFVEIKTTGTKEGHEVGEAVKGIMISAKKALADGKVSADEYGQIAMENFKSLMDAISGVEQLPAEAKEAPLALSRSIFNPITEGVEALLEKKAE